MFYISHRGNLNGINQDMENNPEYLDNAISKGFHVEVDVRVFKDKIYLGHDEPQFKISNDFLLRKEIWCHAKDIYALEVLKKIQAIYFWHQNDDYTLTSNGYFWTYPGKVLVKNSICVLPETSNYSDIKCKGICSDYIEKYIK